MLIWTDLETTGLHPKRDIILEVAVVVTNDDCHEIACYQSLVIEENPARFIPQSSASASQLTDNEHRAIYDAHFDNGLVTELCVAADKADPFPSLRHVQKEVIDFLVGVGVHDGLPMKERPPLAGSTIDFDRRFLAEQMPDVLNLLHYRNVDVSTIKTLAEKWWPELPLPEKKGAHRALDDIRESINLLRYFREKEFICGP